VLVIKIFHDLGGAARIIFGRFGDTPLERLDAFPAFLPIGVALRASSRASLSLMALSIASGTGSCVSFASRSAAAKVAWLVIVSVMLFSSSLDRSTLR
jgi:hypothetical protein